MQQVTPMKMKEIFTQDRVAHLSRFRRSLLVCVSASVLGVTGALAQENVTAGDTDTIVTSPLFVTASPLATTDEDVAGAVTVLDRAEIIHASSGTIGGLLKDRPGISESSFAAGASRPIIRGLDNTRVRIQENGIGSADVSAVSEDHGVPIDPLAAKRVEVVRGPATLRYGSEAIGGVVNILNNRIPVAMPRGGFDAELSAAYDTGSNGRQLYGEMNAGEGNILFHLDSFVRKADDYRVPGTPDKQAHTWSEASGIAGGASVLLDTSALNGYAGASVSYYDSQYGIPAPHNPADPIHIDMRQTKVQLASELDFKGRIFTGLNLTGGYADYSHGEIDSAGDTGSRFDNKEWEGRAELLHGAIGPFTGALGVHYRTREVSASGEGGELIAPSDTDAIAAFLFEEVPLAGEALKLQLAGRVEHVEVTGTGMDLTGTEFDAKRSFTPVSLSGGLVWNTGNGWLFGLNAQRAERAPDALELFSKGPHEATETFEIGDAGLSKETAQTFEITARRSGEDYSFEAALYHTDFKDFIYKRLTGELCDDDFPSCTIGGVGPGTELDQVLFTQEDARFQGFEAAGRVTVMRWSQSSVGLTGQFDVVRAKLDGGGNVPRIPPVRAGLGAFYQDDTFSGEVSFLHAFAQDKLGVNESKTGSYTNLKAALRYQIPGEIWGKGNMELALIGENLLDHDIRNHVSFKKEDVLQPGRNVRLVMTARF